MVPLPPRRGAASHTAPRADRWLQALGADPHFADDVLGDLAEEYALRIARDGAGAARWWYVREAVRAVPHLVASAVRHVIRHGDRRARARLAAWLTGAALTPVAVAVALVLRDGPPVRLVAATSASGGVVVNSLRPVRLPLQVFDERGHPLNAAAVRYRWISGVPATVSPEGVVTCTRRGDAVVRASLGRVATDVLLRCRPVRAVAAAAWEIPLVVGGPARVLAFRALDAELRPVAPLTGVLRVRDSSVAAIIAVRGGHRVAPRAPGRTLIDAQVGDQHTSVHVIVYAPVPTLDGLRPEQRYAATPVRLANGETRRWRLAPGTYVALSVVPDASGGPTPRLAVRGANCIASVERGPDVTADPSPGGGEHFVCVAGPNAWVIAYHPWQAAPAPPLTGYVAVRQLGDS